MIIARPVLGPLDEPPAAAEAVELGWTNCALRFATIAMRYAALAGVVLAPG